MSVKVSTFEPYIFHNITVALAYLQPLLSHGAALYTLTTVIIT